LFHPQISVKISPPFLNVQQIAVIFGPSPMSAARPLCPKINTRTSHMNVVDLNFRAITGGREVENVSAMHQNLT